MLCCFHRGQPVYVAFDVLYANGVDLRGRPLARGKAVLKRPLRERHDLIVIDSIAGRGMARFIGCNP
jgi:ATP-dependent DNA ligase